MDLKVNESIKCTIKEDVNYMTNNEFYNRSRTPSYAVQIIKNSIENNPITESYLLHHNLISFTANNNNTKLSLRSRKPISSNEWSKGSQISSHSFSVKLPKYLIPQDLPNVNISAENSKLGKQTNSPILKNKMVSTDFISENKKTHNKGWYTSRFPTKLRARSENSNTYSENILKSIDYSFIVGARYNNSRFLNVTLDQKNSQNLKESNQEENLTKSVYDSYESFPSSTNSPLFVKTCESLLNVNKKDIELQSVPMESNLGSETNGISEKVNIGSVSRTAKTGSSVHSLVSSVSIKSSILPIVIGQKCSSSEPINVFQYNSVSKTNWTRASMNLHITRQLRNMRNRRQDNMKSSMKQTSMTVVNKSRNEHKKNDIEDSCLKNEDR